MKTLNQIVKDAENKLINIYDELEADGAKLEEGEQAAFIEGTGFRYAITSNGRAYSFVSSKWLLKEMRGGYERIGVYKNGKTVHLTVHKLVAWYFCDKPVWGDIVHHIDGDRTNNKADNLRWVDRRLHDLLHGKLLHKFCIDPDDIYCYSIMDVLNYFHIGLAEYVEIASTKKVKQCKYYWPGMVENAKLAFILIKDFEIGRISNSELSKEWLDGYYEYRSAKENGEN